MPRAKIFASKTGDVDDSASLGLSENYETTQLQVEDLLLNKGQTYEVPMMLLEDTDIKGFELHLDFNTEEIEILSVISDIDGFNSENYNIIDSKLHIISTSENINNLGSSNPVVSIIIRANQNTVLNEVIGLSTNRNSFILDQNFELIELGIELDNLISSDTEDITLHSEIFTIYPNPASDYITIDFSDKKTTPNFKISIFDVTGKLVHKSFDKHIISVQSMNDGLYIYKVAYDDKNYTGRFLVQK